MNICLKKLTNSNFPNYYEIRCDDKNVLYTGHSKMPEYDRLKEWAEDVIKEGKNIYLAEYNNVYVGYLQFDIKDKVAEIGYGVYYKYNNKGIGTAIIENCINMIEDVHTDIEEIIAWIAEFNEPSMKCVLHNNFMEIENTKMEFYDGFGKEFIMKKYSYKTKSSKGL